MADPPTTFGIEYLRPDGWWLAGKGWDDRESAEADAREQLPPQVKWRVVEVDDSDTPEEVRAYEAEERDRQIAESNQEARPE